MSCIQGLHECQRLHVQLCTHNSVPCSGYENTNGYTCGYAFVVRFLASVALMCNRLHVWSHHRLNCMCFCFQFEKDVQPRYLCSWAKKASPKEPLLQNFVGSGVADDAVEDIVNKGTMHQCAKNGRNVCGYFAGPSAKDNKKGAGKGKESEEKAPPKARMKQSTKGGRDGESSAFERSHGLADFQRLKVVGQMCQPWPRKEWTPILQRPPTVSHPRERQKRRELTWRMCTMPQGMRTRKRRTKRRSHCRSGNGKAKSKNLKTSFTVHGRAKAGEKALWTTETRAGVNARSPHLEQLY